MCFLTFTGDAEVFRPSVPPNTEQSRFTYWNSFFFQILIRSEVMPASKRSRFTSSTLPERKNMMQILGFFNSNLLLDHYWVKITVDVVVAGSHHQHILQALLIVEPTVSVSKYLIFSFTKMTVICKKLRLNWGGRS